VSAGDEQLVRALLQRIRPEVDLAALPADAPLRDELDLDSMDFLNFVIALEEATGAVVPEREYGALATLAACARYLEAHRAPQQAE
jgi:acyl carrier protein